MENMDDDISGKIFANFDTAEKFIHEFEKRHSHPMKHASRTTVAQYNRKIRGESAKITDLPTDAVYSVRWNCKHFGDFKNRAG